MDPKQKLCEDVNWIHTGSNGGPLWTR